MDIEIYRDRGSIDIQFINDFQIQIGYKLPSEYKALMSTHNAARLKKSSFNFKYENEDNSHSFIFLGFGTEISRTSQISRAQQTEYCHDHIIVIGVAANGDYICFDYRADPTTDNPPVVLMFHDDYDENDKMIICPVADNFESFIDSLYTWNDED
jgi:hypothetical protein